MREAIERYVDPHALKVLEVAEESERKLFEQIAGHLPKIGEMIAALDEVR